MTPALERLHFPAERSRGRRYPEPPHPYRNEFQRDRDRIVHSRAFRRLEDKTQVYSAPLSDHFRNRLTHTVEVAQIARTVAATLGLNEDLTEALALAHDLGHPPFGHAGEERLNAEMRRFSDRFDHNLHALRLVESFEQRYAQFPGLNLTFEVREGIVKHSRDFQTGELPELDEYLVGMRPPLEAQLIDLADEIAYSTADLDDAYFAGFLSMETISGSLPFFARLHAEVSARFPNAPERIRFQEVLRRLIDSLASGLIEGTLAETHAAGVTSVEEVRRFPARLAKLAPAARQTLAELKSFLRREVYFSAELVRERSHCAEMVGALFQFLLDHPDRLPAGYREALEERPAHRVVCDYLAGMTDGYFRRTYREMLGEPQPG